MSSAERVEIRAVIKFCRDSGHTPSETFKMVQKTQHKHSVSRALVFKWHKRFSEGRETLQDDSGRGRKSKITTFLVTSIEDALEKDRRLTVRELAEMFDLGVATMHEILTSRLNMSKVHARWVPRLLKEHDKERRQHESRAFLRRHAREGDTFLNRIITTDETWLWLYDPETKSQSAVWKRPGSPPPEKARVQRSGGRFMFIMFCDRRGMILQHAVSNSTTVNADYYSKVLRRDLTHALRKKRPEIPIEEWILHQDNASPHTAASTKLEISLLGMEILPHPPYSPDLAPFDFALFPTIKSQLKGNRFQTLAELRTATNNIVAQYNEDWYRSIYSQWIHRHQRCVACNGEYFEKK